MHRALKHVLPLDPEIECMDTASSSKQVANYARRIKSFWTHLDFKHNVHILIQRYDT